jgi:hypothetical protein
MQFSQPLPEYGIARHNLFLECGMLMDGNPDVLNVTWFSERADSDSDDYISKQNVGPQTIQDSQLWTHCIQRETQLGAHYWVQKYLLLGLLYLLPLQRFQGDNPVENPTIFKQRFSWPSVLYMYITWPCRNWVLRGLKRWIAPCRGSHEVWGQAETSCPSGPL